MIYQHVNKRAKILPLATSRIAHLCEQFNQVCTTNFYATFRSIIYYQYGPKIKLFLKKNAKFSSAGGFAPTPPIASGSWGLCSYTPTKDRQLRIFGYAPATLCIVCGFCSFCFELFFLDRLVANLMMLTIVVCLMPNCFLSEKFYLHYALCDFDSILLHCSKLFICQSIDREQIFGVTFENPH